MKKIETKKLSKTTSPSLINALEKENFDLPTQLVTAMKELRDHKKYKSHSELQSLEAFVKHGLNMMPYVESKKANLQEVKHAHQIVIKPRELRTEFKNVTEADVKTIENSDL